MQPVFHVYDVRYIISPPGIIVESLPEKTKYTNLVDITTTNFSRITELQREDMCVFIRGHYLQDGSNRYDPVQANIVPYFSNHEYPSYVSVFAKKTMLYDAAASGVTTLDKTVGVITSRPVYIDIIPSSSTRNITTKFMAHYVDYLCVDKSERGRGVAAQLIQTHNHNQCRGNCSVGAPSPTDKKNAMVSLFKREGTLTGIVPICVYSSYSFSVDSWERPSGLPGGYSVVSVTEQTMPNLRDFLKSLNRASRDCSGGSSLGSPEFDIIINTDLSNIVELMRTNNIFIRILILNNEVVCAYFFRDTCTVVDNTKRILSCFASINGIPAHDSNNLAATATATAMPVPADTFVKGFKISFWEVANSNNFGFCDIENISHNNKIIDDLLVKNRPVCVSPTAYFFYNYAYPTFNSNRVFILC